MAFSLVRMSSSARVCVCSRFACVRRRRLFARLALNGSQTKLGERRGAVEEAHRHGLPATAHVHAVPAIANAVAAGFDMIEHCTFLTATGMHADPDVINAMTRAGTTMTSRLTGPLASQALGERTVTVLTSDTNQSTRAMAAGPGVLTPWPMTLAPAEPGGWKGPLSGGLGRDRAGCTRAEKMPIKVPAASDSLKPHLVDLCAKAWTPFHVMKRVIGDPAAHRVRKPDHAV